MLVEFGQSWISHYYNSNCDFIFVFIYCIICILNQSFFWRRTSICRPFYEQDSVSKKQTYGHPIPTSLYTIVFCRTLQKILFVDMAIIAFMTMGWIFGITASHFQKDSLVIFFLVSHFLLALIVFGLRCLMDDQVSHINSMFLLLMLMENSYICWVW